MIIVMKPQATQQQVDRIVEELVAQGLQVQKNQGTQVTVLGVLGDTELVEREKFSLRQGVDRIVRVQEPYKKANRKFHPVETV
ncbi:MAG: 3-deoxy-7-phosphoheptulonate synthase, partial [Christensenellales bacterium]